MKFYVFLVIIASCLLFINSDKLGESLSPDVCCECVDIFLCVNGTISTDGTDLIDVRIGDNNNEPSPVVNVDECPNELDICCNVPDLPPSCQIGVIPTEKPTYIEPPSDAECECIGYDECYPEAVVSNGLGNVTIELSNGRKVSHSKCTHSLDVCCFVFDYFNYDTTSDSIIPDEECVCVEPELCGPDGHIQTHGVGVINLRIRTNPKPCPHDPNLACCRPPKVQTDSPPHLPIKVSTIKNDVKHCECVIPAMCGTDGYIKTDGAGLIDVRIGSNAEPEICPYDPNLVCCRVPEDEGIVTTPSSISTNIDEGCECVEPALCGPDGHIRPHGEGIISVRVGSSTTLRRCTQNPDLVCCLPPKITTPAPFVPPQCGYRNNYGIGVRILGFTGGQTQFGEFPWVASILKHEVVAAAWRPFFLGGASLIHPRVAMTAAHKVKKYNVTKLFVRLGDWDIASTKESAKHIEVAVQQIVIHPNFNERTLFHDVALLVLKEEVNSSYHINPICLAKSINDVNRKSCVVNGWGVDGFRSENYQEIMKSVELPLVLHKRCQNLLRQTRLSQYFMLDKSFICAGAQEGRDACKGDGGGPLSCQSKSDPSVYLQVGITAWGIGCGEKDVPGVYASIPHDYAWIEAQMQYMFPDDSSYFPKQQEEEKKKNKNKRKGNKRNRVRNRTRNIVRKIFNK